MEDEDFDVLGELGQRVRAEFQEPSSSALHRPMLRNQLLERMNAENGDAGFRKEQLHKLKGDPTNPLVEKHTAHLNKAERASAAADKLRKLLEP